MRAEIEDFILYLATERGLSDNYQLSTRRSLESFADWAGKIKVPGEVTAIALTHLHDYLAHRKRSGLAAASTKLEVVALKIFFRWPISFCRNSMRSMELKSRASPLRQKNFS